MDSICVCLGNFYALKKIAQPGMQKKPSVYGSYNSGTKNMNLKRSTVLTICKSYDYISKGTLLT